ncbi:MAG: glycosyltransferase [Streptosporangiales bacterium]|nr:glycosyltransferase [Streptosporangiales bacterium]
MITFAIAAHNEAECVEGVIGQAQEAAERGDRVLLVDSASTDDTADRARKLGVEVIDGPLGKGAAMAAGAARVTTPWLCFLDGDMVEPHLNIPSVLRAAAARAGDDTITVIGDFDDPPPQPVLGNTWAVYEPPVRALFPEAADRFGSHPLSGFRVIRPEIAAGMPADFGAEAYLNLRAATSGRPWDIVHIGTYKQRFRYHGAAMGREVAAAIFDLAVTHGRLTPADRPAWESWVERIVTEIAIYHGDHNDRAAWLTRVTELATTPLPGH